MRKPIIGVVMNHSSRSQSGGQNGSPERLLSHVNDEVVQALLDNGAVPLGIPSPHRGINFIVRRQVTGKLMPLLDIERQSLQGILELCDGLVFQGGAKIELFAIHLAKMAYEQKVPALGICSGQTTMAMAFDDATTIWVNQEFHRSLNEKYVHTVEVVPGTRFHEIVGCTSISVNSRHRQAIGACPQLRVAARYTEVKEDAHIEVLEAKDRFYLSTRFHPESLYREDEKMNAIFRAFVTEAGRSRG